MLCDPDGSSRINSFAVVNYVRGPLADFLDRLRAELVTGCDIHAHVTILPPRPVPDPAAAIELITSRVPEFHAFVIEGTNIRVFPETNVIYTDIGMGRSELIAMHSALNIDGLHFNEPYVYHPHLTLAQGLEPGTVAQLLELANRRWREFRHSRTFVVDSLTFVQNTIDNTWVDLARWELRGAAELHAPAD
jgi:2'-5' RNA ligase